MLQLEPMRCRLTVWIRSLVLIVFRALMTYQHRAAAGRQLRILAITRTNTDTFIGHLYSSSATCGAKNTVLFSYIFAKEKPGRLPASG